MVEVSKVPSSQKSELLSNMLKTILDMLSPEKVILFGSQATGTSTEASDYDFLFVKSEPFGETGSRRKEAGKLGWALSGLGIAADVLIYSPEEIEQRRHWQNGVVADALSEGKVLYERT